MFIKKEKLIYTMKNQVEGGMHSVKKIKIMTPENIEIEYTLANLGSRTAAAVIDMLIIFAIVLVILVIPLVIIMSTSKWAEQYYGWAAGISIITSMAVYYSYFIISEMAMNGRTIGKRVLNIRTIRNNGQPITLKHSAIRNLFKLLIDMEGVGAVLIYINKEHKRIGDMLASTIVVADNEVCLPEAFRLESQSDDGYYFLTREEKEIISDYFRRRNSISNEIDLQSDILNYFAARKVPIEAQEEYQKFYNELRDSIMVKQALNEQ